MSLLYSKKEEENACLDTEYLWKEKKKDEKKVNHIATEVSVSNCWALLSVLIYFY